jgi:hypothetical protein
MEELKIIALVARFGEGLRRWKRIDRQQMRPILDAMLKAEHEIESSGSTYLHLAWRSALLFADSEVEPRPSTYDRRVT